MTHRTEEGHVDSPAPDGGQNRCLTVRPDRLEEAIRLRIVAPIVGVPHLAPRPEQEHRMGRPDSRIGNLTAIEPEEYRMGHNTVPGFSFYPFELWARVMLKSYRSILIPLVLGISVSVSAQNWNLPSSPTGQALGVLLDVIATGDQGAIASFVTTHMDEQFLTVFSMDDHIAFFTQVHDQVHPFEIVSLKNTGDYSAEAVIAGTDSDQRLRIRFSLSAQPPHLFNGLNIQPASGPEPSFSTIPELAEYLSERERSGTFSGVVLIGRDGDVEVLEAYGQASKRYGVPNRIDTKFNLGSINKMFTGVAVLQLAEKGLIDLDASISEYIGDFPEDVGSKVTVRHLLRHRAGWGSYFDKEHYRNNWPWLRSVSDYMEFIPQIPLDFEPGTSRQYSNVGYVVLGAVIEAVTGRDYYEFVADNIFQPAGMESTDSYEVDRPVPNLAEGYVTDSPEKPFSRVNTFMHSAKGTPAGGGYSTAEDLLRFDHALRNHRLLSPEYTNLFFRGFEGEPAGGVLEGGAGYAGGAPGINAVLEMDFPSGLTVIVLSNYDPPSAEELGSAIMEMVRGSN